MKASGAAKRGADEGRTSIEAGNSSPITVYFVVRTKLNQKLRIWRERAIEDQDLILVEKKVLVDALGNEFAGAPVVGLVLVCVD